ncbi:unnamed protein product [Blepharisma stoltei]|uniref:Maltase n=1 Tax=Blepharisma stoltei TaxID=1481888 RepID=A0AAU9K326_9CILI|nr:unnamed protein product [Blepharisma stoltei]
MVTFLFACFLIVIVKSQRDLLSIEESKAEYGSGCQGPAMYPIYQASNIISNSNSISATISLSQEGNQCMGASIPKLLFQATYISSSIVRVTIRDANNQRWEPDNYPNTPGPNQNHPQVIITQNPFSFSVVRVEDQEVLWNTSNRSTPPFLYSNLYLEVGSSLPSNPNIYGLGERVTSFRLDTNETFYTLWSLAQDCPYDTGKGQRGQNMYGHHPVYLEMRNGAANGVYFHNVNAMDVVFSNGRIAFKTIGGIMDLYFFKGPTPEAVLEQYHSIIGLPMLPPYWALGYHQCRWGYKRLGDLWDVVTGYESHGIPFDVLWSDIDYMQHFQDFTLDYSRYSLTSMSSMLQYVKSSGRFFVPIIDAGIAQTGNFAEKAGLEMDVFIKRNPTTQEEFIGLVWPGKTYFVDFFHPNASSYWSNMLDILHESVQFDGIWIDMNEASSFCDGECPGFYPDPELQITLPYTPGNHSLEDQLLPLLAKHYGSNLYVVFNTHSMYGTMETIATNEYLQKKFDTRAFILSRSTRPGHGTVGFHWLGDNYSTWDMLRYSIQGILNFQIFGIPIVGADVCGFHNNTTPELCSRWLELGAFYTFYRNHNDIGAQSQELYALGPLVQEIGTNMIRLRYYLHVYMYSCIFKVALNGGSVLKPMFFEFPEYEEFYSNQEQFMLGQALVIAPALYEGQTSVNVTLPNTTLWYDFFTGDPIESGNIQLDAPIDKINVIIRGGYIVPTQNSASAMSLTSMRSQGIELVIALASNQTASGYYYVDDGLSLNTIANKNYTMYNLTVGPDSDGHIKLKISPNTLGYLKEMNFLTGIKVYGLPKKNDVNYLLNEAGIHENNVLKMTLNLDISLPQEIILA